MSIFKKNSAVTIDHMSVISKVTVDENAVRFLILYNSIDMKIEELPKLLGDIIQLYALVKPLLDDKEEKLLAEKATDPEPDKAEDDSLIDLSNIPF